MSNQSVPGMMYPTQQAMVGSNPRDSARVSLQNQNQSQAQANKLMSGGKYRKKRGGDGNGNGNGTITVPQYQMLYTPTGGPGTNPNDQIQGNAQTSTQMSANSVYDNNATKMGGTRRRRSKKGGNPDWLWGCYSGGRKMRRKSHKKRTRKIKRTRRH